jgi:hypothetical protein
MSQPIQIQLKTLSGDLFPLEVSPSVSLEEIAQRASVTYPESFPSGRTKVLAMEEEQKEREEGEILLVVVSDPPLMEEGRYPQGGQPYVRWTITLGGETYYLYIVKWWKSHANGVIYPEYAIGKTETVTKPSETHGPCYKDLWLIISEAVPVTPKMMKELPKKMKELREMMNPYLERKTEEHGGWPLVHYMDKEEPVECGCGSVIKYAGMKAHEKTKKHKTWAMTQP